MLGNLVDNGLKWSKGAVRISVLDHTAEQVKIVVEDDGPGISEEERSTILKRGKRLDEEKTRVRTWSWYCQRTGLRLWRQH